MEPNRENIRKWVDALRSGEYEQGAGALRRGWKESGDQRVAHCCLGVACEAAMGDGVPLRHHNFDGYIGSQFIGTNSVLPDVVSEWLGLIGGDPVIGSHPTMSGDLLATNANDDLGWSFTQIAEAIERRYLDG